MDFWQRLPNNEHVKRALEIGVAGSHSTLIIVPKELDRDFYNIKIRLGGWVKTVPPCPCGKLTEREYCDCSPASIMRHIKKMKAENYEIVIWATLPRPADLKSAGEPYFDVRARISAMTNYSNLDIDQTSHQFMKYAKERLDIDVDVVMRIARTIANLEQKKNIHVAHVSEAIQYQPQTATILGVPLVEEK